MSTAFAIFILGSLLVITILFGVQACLADDIRSEATGDYVVLLHGMDRTALSMKRMEFYLRKNGYATINITYPSRRLTVQELSENYLRPLLEEKITNHNCKINFVTHSLGGIIVRQYLADHAVTNLGRVVMLGPPNHGSEIIDALRANPISRRFLSPAGLELGAKEDNLPARLGAVQFECGVVAGDRSLNPLLSAMLGGPNDGKVTVESAKVSGMRDFLEVHLAHLVDVA